MADAGSIFLKFWNNKKARNLTILVILVIFMLISLQTCYSKIYSDKPIEGSTRTYICPKCEYTGKMLFVEVGEIQCPKCTTTVGFAWKCRNCQREFSVKPSKITKLMSKKQLINKKRSEGQCPNCQSFDTYPLAK